MGPKQYPRVYFVEARMRRAGNAIALSPLAIMISVGFLSRAGLTYKPVTPSALLVMCFLAGLWALLLASPAHRRVVLHEDAIEVLGWFFGPQTQSQRDYRPTNGGNAKRLRRSSLRNCPGG